MRIGQECRFSINGQLIKVPCFFTQSLQFSLNYNLSISSKSISTYHSASLKDTRCRFLHSFDQHGLSVWHSHIFQVHWHMSWNKRKKVILKMRAVVWRKELKFENLNYLTLIVHNSWMLLEHWGGVLIMPAPSRSTSITVQNKVIMNEKSQKF